MFSYFFLKDKFVVNINNVLYYINEKTSLKLYINPLSKSLVHDFQFFIYSNKYSNTWYNQFLIYYLLIYKYRV